MSVLQSISITSSIFYFAIMACVILLAEFIARKSSFYHVLTTSKHDTYEAESMVNTKLKNRHEMLDGLRGFLALGVLFQHAITNFTYYSTGIWKITDVRFYRHAGGEAVILFFMITSFLYWSKAISSRGKLDAKSIYRNRFKRLAPMYLFSAAIVTISVLIQSGLQITSVWALLKDVGSWLSLGLITTTSINGLSIIPINAGIHWTLHYEWIFYLLLPFAAIALRRGWHRLVAIPFIALVLTLSDWGYWIIFLFGITAAHIVHRFPRVQLIHKSGLTLKEIIGYTIEGRPKPKNSIRLIALCISFLPIIGLLAIYFIQYKPYGVPQYVISLGILLIFIYGNSLFGLLNTRAARFLGTISYSVYLMHGIVLFAVLNISNSVIPVGSLTPVLYWSLILLAAIITVLVSAITYKYVEHPFFQKR